MDNSQTEIDRLHFEDLLWITFITLAVTNILGNYCSREYLRTNNKNYDNMANKLFIFALTVTFFIYIYFFFRNYRAFNNASREEKNLFQVKVIGSTFLIAGIVCLIYFQTHESDFVGSPAL